MFMEKNIIQDLYEELGIIEGHSTIKWRTAGAQPDKIEDTPKKETIDFILKTPEFVSMRALTLPTATVDSRCLPDFKCGSDHFEIVAEVVLHPTAGFEAQRRSGVKAKRNKWKEVCANSQTQPALPMPQVSIEGSAEQLKPVQSSPTSELGGPMNIPKGGAEKPKPVQSTSEIVEWQDAGNWIPYDPVSQKKILHAIMRGQTCELEIGGNRFMVRKNGDQFEQVSLTTYDGYPFKRAVRITQIRPEGSPRRRLLK